MALMMVIRYMIMRIMKKMMLMMMMMVMISMMVLMIVIRSINVLAMMTVMLPWNLPSKPEPRTPSLLQVHRHQRGLSILDDVNHFVHFLFHGRLDCPIPENMFGASVENKRVSPVGRHGSQVEI